jgi:quinol-cytochrome oxidoreductase complex cytochrome b subunit
MANAVGAGAHDAPETGGHHARRPEMVPVWPDLLFRELLAALLCLVGLAVVSLLLNAPLEDPADPTRTPNPAKAPWYFVGLQELLTRFDPWMAGVVIPILVVLGLCLIPYIDPTRHAQGVYSVRERPLASTIFITGMAGWIALTVIGLWCRGPDWSWIGPGAVAAGSAAPSVPRALPNAIGIPLVLAYWTLGSIWITRRFAGVPGFTRWRRWTFAFLLLAMAGTVIKVGLSALFGIHHLVRFERAGFGL